MLAPSFRLSTRRSLAVATLAAGCAAAPSSAQAVVIVNDTFADNTRTTESLPTSVQWTVGAHNGTAANAFGTLDASTGQMVLDHTNAGSNSFAAVWGHFTASGSPLNLAVNDRLTLTFDVTFSGGAFPASPGAGGFRWALFNSNGSRVTTDFAGTNETGISNGTTFSGWRGYEGQSAISNVEVTGEMLTRERTGSGNGLYTSSNWATVGSSVDEPTITAGTPVTASLVLTRTATGVTVQAGLAGATTAATLDTGGFTAFDTISFFTLDGLSHDITVDNVRLETDVVPEPTAASVMLLGAALLAARRRRRTC